MALDQAKLDASLKKFGENAITKENVATIVTEQVSTYQARIDELEAAITKIADALDGDDTEAAQAVIEEVKPAE